MSINLIRMAVLTAILCFYSHISNSQNQRLADSLVVVLEQGGLNDDQRISLLQLIAAESTSPNDIVTYSELLIEESKVIGDYKNTLLGYIHLGYANKINGELTQALEAYLEAAEIAASNNDLISQAEVYGNIASLYTSNEDYKKSLDYYQEALELYTNKVDSQRLAIVYINYSWAAYKASMYDSAISLSNKAIYFAQFSEYEIIRAYAQSNKALALAKAGSFSESESLLATAMLIMESNEDNYALSDCLIEIGGVYLEQGNLKKAIDNLEKGYQIAMSHGLKEQIQNGTKFLSTAYVQVGDLKKAIDFQSKYYNYRDSLINTEKIRELADLRTEYEVGQKQIEVDLLEEKQKGFFFAVFFLIILLLLIGTLAYVFIMRNKEKQAANQLLTKQTQELEALNTTKDRFFSIISHDLRSPVSAFKGLSSLIKFSVDQKSYDDLPEITERITNSADKLSLLLDNLLEWAINQQGQLLYTPIEVNLKELVEEIVPIFHNMAQSKKITLETNVSENVVVWAEANSIMTILRNLISNAIKFTENGGQIDVSVTRTTDLALLEVKDTGVGMPKEKLDSLFVLKEKKSTWGTEGEKGLGLGLRLAHEFTEMNKGSISVESQEGVGSIFIVKIPLFSDLKKLEN